MPKRHSNQTQWQQHEVKRLVQIQRSWEVIRHVFNNRYSSNDLHSSATCTFAVLPTAQNCVHIDNKYLYWYSRYWDELRTGDQALIFCGYHLDIAVPENAGAVHCSIQKVQLHNCDSGISDNCRNTTLLTESTYGRRRPDVKSRSCIRNRKHWFTTWATGLCECSGCTSTWLPEENQVQRPVILSRQFIDLFVHPRRYLLTLSNI